MAFASPYKTMFSFSNPIQMQKIFYLLICLFAATALFAQTGGIQGKVTDEKGDALIGATIQTIGSIKRGATTDVDGMYRLTLPAGTHDIEVSFVGFVTKKITNIKSENGKFTKQDFFLEEASKILESVVVTGEYTVKRKATAVYSETKELHGAPAGKGAKKAAPRGSTITRSSEPSRSATPMPAPPPPPAEPSFRREVEVAKTAKAEAARAIYDKKAAIEKRTKSASAPKVASPAIESEVADDSFSDYSRAPATPLATKLTEAAKIAKEKVEIAEEYKTITTTSTTLDGESKKITKADAAMEDSRKAKPTFLETASATEKAKMDAETADESLPDEPEQKAGQLTAGEWSDLKNWNFWLRSIDTAFSTYHKNWKYNFDDRYAVNVVGAENQPIADAQVRLLATDGALVWESRTDNHGNAELWSGLFGGKYTNLVFKVLHNGKTFDFKNAKTFKTSLNTLKINASCSALTGLDIAFVVDATGSMGDEIAYLKSEVVDVIRRVKMNNQSLDIRTASVFYRDFSDEYVTKIFPFGKSLKQNLAFIRNQFAGGGGDFEEAVPEGLEAGIDSLKWSENALARIMFLILDAPPHLTPENIEKLHRLTQKAAQKGIRIIPITASGIDKNVEYLMKSLGVTTGGTYVFLTDDSGIGGGHIKATTEKHEVEHLNDLMVRLIKDATDTETCRRLAEKASTGGDAPLDASFKLSPTPASSTIYVDMKNDIESLRITNVHGQIMEDLYDLKTGTKEIAVSTWASGVYYATVKQGNKVSTKKFSVIR
jgi:hypothetical protein